MKTNVSLSIDYDILKQAKEILEHEKIKISHYVEAVLKNLIDKQKNQEPL